LWRFARRGFIADPRAHRGRPTLRTANSIRRLTWLRPLVTVRASAADRWSATDGRQIGLVTYCRQSEDVPMAAGMTRH
jgi:hypothetical protein